MMDEEQAAVPGAAGQEAEHSADSGPPAAAEDGTGPGTPGTPGAPKPKRRGSFLRELPILVVIALALALLIKTYAFQAYFIPTGSMQNTLAIGDKVLVNKIVYHLRPIHRGDIVVFNGAGSWDPKAPPTPNPFDRLYRAIIGLFGAAPGQTDYIKRVIGIPGDHVRCCDALGRVTVNGTPLSEKSYLYPGNVPSVAPFSVIVPAGHLWVMGDHRLVSDDSRDHVGFPGGGAIPENEVVGRAFWIVWPAGRWQVLPIPATFEQPALSGGKTAGGKTAGGNAAGGRAAGGSAAGGRAAAGLQAAGSLISAPVVPATPVVPLAAGLVGAVPLTWALRRLRGRILRQFARRR